MGSPDYALMSPEFAEHLKAELVRDNLLFYATDYASGGNFTAFTVHGVKVHPDSAVPKDTIFFTTVNEKEVAKGTKHVYQSYFGHDEEKTMSDAMRRMLFSYPHRFGLESVLGIKSEPLKPGSTVLGPDGHEYIVNKLAPKPKAAKPPKKDYNTLGVRFLEGGNLERVYTYRVKKGAKLHLGQEIVVPAQRGQRVSNFVAVVVELHKTPQDTGPHSYKFVAGTVKPL